jgi:RNA polymerase sigma-70 factor (ECF subfamily)
MHAHPRPEAPSIEVEAGPCEAGRSFGDFYRSRHQRLFTALCLVTGNRQEAEEIMQDAFLRLFERWDRVSSAADLDGYLFRTAMNVFRNRYRRALVAARRVLTAEPPVDDFAAVEARDEVVRLLRCLQPRQRAAVVLTSILDYSSEEAGRLLKIRASTVRALTTQARAQLKGTQEKNDE